MSRHKDLFQTIAQLEHDETPYAIATVFQVHQSSSGKVGDKALYSEEGKGLPVILEEVALKIGWLRLRRNH